MEAQDQAKQAARRPHLLGRRAKPDVEETHLRGVMKTQKAEKEPVLRATVFPRQGGAPYVVDVEVQEGGTFSFKDAGLTYCIAPGSVWKEDGVYRCIVNEGNAMTIHGHSLTGDDSMTPEAINGLAWNNLWWQYDDETRPRSAWQRIGAVALGVFAVAIVGVMIWAILSIGNDLESIRSALEGLEPTSTTSGGAPGSGHQPIAPGGR